MRQRLDDSAGEIIAGPAVELHPRADLTGDNPKPIMFDFVQPRFAGWRVRGFGGQAGGDEAGRYAIHTLLIAYKRRLRSRSTADSLNSRGCSRNDRVHLGSVRQGHTPPIDGRRAAFLCRPSEPPHLVPNCLGIAAPPKKNRLLENRRAAAGEPRTWTPVPGLFRCRAASVASPGTN